MAEAVIVFELPVERGKVREFALAVAEDNPIHYDADEARRRGLPDIVAPPTFTVTQMWQVPREERERRLGANLAYERVLHGEQEFFYRRLPVAGEVLTGRMRIASDVTKRGRRGGAMRVVTYESVFSDASGDEVVRALYTLMELPLVSVPSDLRLGDVFSGMDLAEVVFGPLERADIVRYAGAAGDFNPIHLDDAYAGAGAPTAFAMGMLPAGYLAHAVSDWFGGPQHLRRFRVRFLTRVWPGDEIVCSGRVDEIEGRLVRVRFEADRRGPGPRELELPEREPAISGDADVEPPA